MLVVAVGGIVGSMVVGSVVSVGFCWFLLSMIGEGVLGMGVSVSGSGDSAVSDGVGLICGVGVVVSQTNS